VTSHFLLRVGRAVSVLAVCIPSFGCTAAIDKYPLPDEFDAAFVTGTVCMPSTIQAGSTFPVRMETCVYRCVEVDLDTVRIRYIGGCQGAACQMQLLLTAHLRNVAGQEDCDARDLPNPPAAECTPQVFPFKDVSALTAGDGSAISGVFVVTVPYLDYEQGNTLVSRLNNGEDALTVIPDVVGMQNYPQRQFPVTFDPAAPAVTLTAEQLGAETCHPIAAP
jgi:hypothetical protein